jgi:hypothetical protein
MSKRNNELLKERNNKIYERYKELYDINHMRHVCVLDKLSKEFYLGTQALSKIIISERSINKVVHSETNHT